MSLKPSQEPQKLISSLWKVALTLGQVGVMSFVQTLWILRQMESQCLKLLSSQDCRSTCASLNIYKDQILFEEGDLGLGWFLLQNDKNTIQSILLDESESEDIHFGQLNMLLSSIFLLENFGLFSSSIPWGALFWTAKKSKNLQNYFLSDSKRKSVINVMVCATCFFLLWSQ